MNKHSLTLILVAIGLVVSGSESLGRRKPAKKLNPIQAEKLKAFWELNGPFAVKPVFCEAPLSTDSPFEAYFFNQDGSTCNETFCDHALYRCKQVASQPVEYEARIAEDIESDCSGAALKHVAMVVGGVGLQIRYNKNVCHDGVTQTPIGSLVVFSGSGGNSWRDAKSNDGTNGKLVGRDPDRDNSATDPDYRALENQGIRVISPKWEGGVDVNIFLKDPAEYDNKSGWATRTIAYRQSWRAMRKRPAAAVQYAIDYLTPASAKFGVAGTSGGSIQSASMFSHPVTKKLDYLGLHGGGGGYANMKQQCGIEKTPIRVNPKNGELCYEGKNCGLSYAHPVALFALRINYDYPSMSTNCLYKRSSSLHTKNSILNIKELANKPAYTGFIANGVSDILAVMWPMGVVKDFLDKRNLKTNWIFSNPDNAQHGQSMQSGHASFFDFQKQLYEAFGVAPPNT